MELNGPTRYFLAGGSASSPLSNELAYSLLELWRSCWTGVAMVSASGAWLGDGEGVFLL